MDEIINAVEAKHLSKHYRVYLKPVDRLKEAIFKRPCHQRVDALQDISFTVGKGGTLGLIGDNGAGKSTLLKLLAKTLSPSSGQLSIHGRVAALLELGSGFHLEFSGRQNIHLNAALLGLKDAEIKAREPDIIAFSELQEVIDRPVKTYSSGMYVRLAFAIATTVDPDVLIVDEALAVGDGRFQQKCIERMVGFRRQGKTILLCSHSMLLINELCDKTLWLDSGKVRAAGASDEVVSRYLSFQQRRNQAEPGEPAVNRRPGALPEVIIESIELIDGSGRPVERVAQFAPAALRFRTRCSGAPIEGHIGIGIEGIGGQMLFTALTRHGGMPAMVFDGVQEGRLEIPAMMIQGGRFRAKIVVSDAHGMRAIDERLSAPFAVLGKHPELGLVWVEHRWHFGSANFTDGHE